MPPAQLARQSLCFLWSPRTRLVDIDRRDIAENGIDNAPGSLPFADDFHVYAIEWTTNQIRWYVDGQVYKTVAPQDLPAGKQWVYDHPFFIILNFAVGGDWPGSPDATTVFPQTMMVDYVRVYQRPS